MYCGVNPRLGQNFCWQCGKPTSHHQEVCLECGVLLKRKQSSSEEVSGSEKVSGAWWLLPIFMGWLGGLTAWLVNKDKDPEKARSMLGTGIALSVIGVLIYLVLICVSIANY